MSHRDDSRQLRDGLEDIGSELDRAIGDQPDTDGVAVVITFAEGTYPTVANASYACHPQDVGGAETEGTSGTYTARSATLYCINLGPTVPPAGTVLLATRTGDRWTIRYG